MIKVSSLARMFIPPGGNSSYSSLNHDLARVLLILDTLALALLGQTCAWQSRKTFASISALPLIP